MNSKTEKILTNAVKIILTRDEINTVKYNADVELAKLTKELQELEKRVRVLRRDIKYLKPFSERTELMIAATRADEILETKKLSLVENGMSEKEALDLIANQGFTWDIIEE